MKNKKNTFNESKDTGLAMVLILLLISYFKGNHHLTLLLAIAILVLTMTWPGAFRPLAGIWFGLSHLLGHIVSKIVLALIFILIVTPVGLSRRMAGKDPMLIKLWKKDQESVFFKRDYIFSGKDLERPY